MKGWRIREGLGERVVEEVREVDEKIERREREREGREGEKAFYYISCGISGPAWAVWKP